nr:hypothetical protein [Pseudoalteromonas rubra]
MSSITRQKFRYLVALNEKFLTPLAAYLLLQIEQVLSEIGIMCCPKTPYHCAVLFTLCVFDGMMVR